MKAHKYWSLGALACMAGCFYTGCKKLMQAHNSGNILREKRCRNQEDKIGFENR